MSDAMLKVMKLQSAPSVEIDTFNGDPLEYEYFKANFVDVVEKSVEEQRGRLTRLIKYTSGEPKELIRHCVQEDPSECYDNMHTTRQRIWKHSSYNMCLLERIA